MTIVVTVYREFFGEPNSSPHEVSRGIYKSKTPIDKEVRCMDLQFHLEAFEFMMILSFVNKKLTMHLPLGLSHLSSLLPFLNYKKGGGKQQKQVTKSFLKENKHM